jgi:cell division protein FtsB
MLERIIHRMPLMSRRTLPVSGAILCVLIGYQIFREGGIWGSWHLSQTYANIESDNQRLREENALMKREVEDLKTNRSRIELEARKMGFVYPDEIAVYWKRDNGTTGRMFIRSAKTATP